MNPSQHDEKHKKKAPQPSVATRPTLQSQLDRSAGVGGMGRPVQLEHEHEKAASDGKT